MILRLNNNNKLLKKKVVIKLIIMEYLKKILHRLSLELKSIMI